MATSKVTPIRARKGATPAYRAIADQAVYEATKNGFDEYFRAIAVMYPNGSSAAAATAYVEALRERLEWYEQADRARQGRAGLS
jgi:hypothetical protein